MIAPHERCALQGFRAEQLAGMSKSGVLCATGNAMWLPVMGAGVPRAIPPPNEGRAGRRSTIGFLQEQVALLEAQEAVLRRRSNQG